MTAKEHYDAHLGNVYSWMLGDFFLKMSGQLEFFRKQGILPTGNHVAFDLGAGNGIQSVALAKIGFSVMAVDFNKQLLNELNANREDLDINTIEEDIYKFLSTTYDKAELIVCMGDTLTHFRNYDQVEKTLERIAALLSEDGKVVFSFRDLSNERKGTNRFFPVRLDDNRSMTCFLEYFPDHVMVYDLSQKKMLEYGTRK